MCVCVCVYVCVVQKIEDSILQISDIIQRKADSIPQPSDIRHQTAGSSSKRQTADRRQQTADLLAVDAFRCAGVPGVDALLMSP
jgi:hypothetical protein